MKLALIEGQLMQLLKLISVDPLDKVIKIMHAVHVSEVLFHFIRVVNKTCLAKWENADFFIFPFKWC